MKFFFTLIACLLCHASSIYSEGSDLTSRASKPKNVSVIWNSLTPKDRDLKLAMFEFYKNMLLGKLKPASNALDTSVKNASLSSFKAAVENAGSPETEYIDVLTVNELTLEGRPSFLFVLRMNRFNNGSPKRTYLLHLWTKTSENKWKVIPLEKFDLGRIAVKCR